MPHSTIWEDQQFTGGNYAVVGGMLTNTSYTDTSVNNGTTYYYVVYAGNNPTGQFSMPSTQASATPLPLPPPPTGLTATAGNAQVALTWNPSANATYYYVGRSTTSGANYLLISGMITNPNYTDTSVSNGTTYYYIVYAGNIPNGNYSFASSQVSATPMLSGTPAVPSGLIALGQSSSIALSWNVDAGAASYNVKRSTVSSGPYSTIASPSSAYYNDTSVTQGTTYYYEVSAVNPMGESPNSAQVSATTVLPVPSAPTGLTATAGHAQVVLTWNPSSNATFYYVGRSTNPNAVNYSVVSGMIANTTYTDTSVSSGTMYYYVVYAGNNPAGGGSLPSSQVSATPQ